MKAFRVLIGLCFVAVFAFAMKGLRLLFDSEGHTFAYGFCAGMALMFVFTWIYEKVCKEAMFKDSFNPQPPDAWPNRTE